MTVPVYIALLHAPVVNRKGAIVTTAVTNMDIHDISRSAKTYGMKGYFIVTPIEDQHELVGRILGHWATDRSKTYHPDRFAAVSLVRLVHSFEEVKAAIIPCQKISASGNGSFDSNHIARRSFVLSLIGSSSSTIL